MVQSTTPKASPSPVDVCLDQGRDLHTLLWFTPLLRSTIHSSHQTALNNENRIRT